MVIDSYDNGSIIACNCSECIDTEAAFSLQLDLIISSSGHRLFRKLCYTCAHEEVKDPDADTHYGVVRAVQ